MAFEGLGEGSAAWTGVMKSQLLTSTLTPFFQSICGPPSFSSGSSNTEGIFLKLKCFMCILVLLSFWSPPFTLPVFPGGSAVKNLPAVLAIWVQSLGQEDPLEKEMAAHSNILAWRIPWTEEPGGLQSMRSQRVRHD